MTGLQKPDSGAAQSGDLPLTLYNFRWGPYPRRLAIYLTEKGIADIARVDVEFPHEPALWPPGFLLALNPAHSLPVLKIGDDVSIGQSMAILEYLEERYPEPDLIGNTAEARAATRALSAVFEEAASFFGIWARQGSALNYDRHAASHEAAQIGAQRFAEKLRVAEAMSSGPFLLGEKITFADCVAMALVEFVDQFYGVHLPADCPKLMAWYARFAQRASGARPDYPSAMMARARGLLEQSGISIEPISADAVRAA